MPFQRVYVVNTPNIIQVIQAKANASLFVPNLLDFGILFSGLNNDSRKIMKRAVYAEGNVFTSGVHKYLLTGRTLHAASRTAIAKLAAEVPRNVDTGAPTGLLEVIRHSLMSALTGAVYGPANPYNDPIVEKSWT